MPVIGENIRRLRLKKGLSQTALAEAIGETRQTLWKYESGTVTNIPLAKVEALAEALDCVPAQILGWQQGESRSSAPMLAVGEQSSPYLTSKEQELLDGFHELNMGNRRLLLQELKTMLAKQQEDDKRRGRFLFSNTKAAHFYACLKKNNPYDDEEFCAWYAAHKFGAKVTAPRFASFRDGVVKGERASEAAEYLTSHRDASFNEVSVMFDVEIKEMQLY